MHKIPKEQNQFLHECELKVARTESKTDLNAGRFIKETVAQHLRRIAKINKAAEPRLNDHHRKKHPY